MQETDLKLKPIRTKNKDSTEEKKEEEEAVLSPASRMFHEPDYNIVIIAVMGWRGEAKIDTIKDNLSNTLLKHPRFSSLQVVDQRDESKIRWVPTEVKIDDHMVTPSLDPNNIDSPDEFVEDYISNLSNTPLDPSKPLWDVHFLLLKNSDSDFVTVFRFHHSLGDGMALVSMLLSNTRKTSDPDSLPNFPTPKKKRNNDTNRRYVRYFHKLWLSLRVVINTFIDLLMFVATVVFLRDTETPITTPPPPPKGGRPQQNRFIQRTVSLDDIKLVKNATNSTVNDVILGIIQAGFSRYLDRRYGEAEKKGRNKISKGNRRLRATVVFNLRSQMDLKVNGEMSEKNSSAKHGNRTGFVLMPFDISLVRNPLDHVRQAKIIMDRKKQSLEAFCTSYILQLVLKFFGFKVAGRVASRVMSRTSLVFSNVMGPIEEISYCGHPMTYLSVTCYGRQPDSTMVHAVSYTNKLTFVISVDKTSVPDPNRLGDDIVESVELMKRAIFEEDKPKHD